MLKLCFFFFKKKIWMLICVFFSFDVLIYEYTILIWAIMFSELWFELAIHSCGVWDFVLGLGLGLGLGLRILLIFCCWSGRRWHEIGLVKFQVKWFYFIFLWVWMILTWILDFENSISIGAEACLCWLLGVYCACWEVEIRYKTIGSFE